LPRGDERLLISFLGRQGPVVITVCRAASLLFAAVADKGCPDKLLAQERDEVRTEIAASTMFTELSAVLLLTDILLFAGLCKLAVIRRIIEG